MERTHINEEKISPISIFLSMFWNSDEDAEKKWQNEPNRKILEEAIADVDEKAPKILPASNGKNRKASRRLSKLPKNNTIVLEAKDQTSHNKNKGNIDKELEL